MNMSVNLFLSLLVSALAVQRVTSWLVKEYGPGHIFERFRNRIGVALDARNQCEGRNVIADMLCCFKCTSVWVSMPLGIYLGNTIVEMAVFTLAISSVAIWLERY